MALNRIILWLGYGLLALAGLMAFTALMSLALQEGNSAAVFGASTLFVSLIGCILVFSTRLTEAKESFSEALAFLVIFWIVLPIFAAFPFYFSGTASSGTIAYFEAVSALTTTGASTLDPDLLSRSLHIWRSLCQWAGGVIVATFAVVILAALNLKGTGVHRSLLFTFRKGELFKHLATVVKVVAGIYLTISALCLCFLVFSGTPFFDAFCLSLTSVSTGGLMPRGDSLDSYVGGVGLFALCISCLLGAFNVAVLWDVFRNRSFREFRRIITNIEHRALFVIVGILFVLGCYYTAILDDIRHVLTVFSEAIFFATSTGYDYQVIGIEQVPPVILISLALVGGSALSTTGGLKLIRILLLFRHLDTDMERLTHPSRVVPVKFRAEVLPDSAFLSIWMYFFGYTMIFAAGILALAATGLGFPVAVAGSAASVANMGPLLDIVLSPQSYADFTTAQLSVSAILMIIGRIEVLAAFAFLSPQLWRS